MLASPLVVFMMTFLFDFSIADRRYCEMRAGPVTLVMIVSARSVGLKLNARSNPRLCTVGTKEKGKGISEGVTQTATTRGRTTDDGGVVEDVVETCAVQQPEDLVRSGLDARFVRNI